MTELDNNDKLLQNFFSESKQQEIADNGFSHRVMSHLPDRSNRLARAWTILMMIMAMVLFIALGGLEAIWGTLREVLISMLQQQSTQLDPKSLIIATIVLLFLGTRKLVSMA